MFCDGIIFNFAQVYFADLGFMEYAKKERKIPVCLECGDKIKYGRMDKKFCCDECKVRHNNKMAKRRAVKITTQRPDYVFISEGVKQGETVIIDGTHKVRIMPGKTEAAVEPVPQQKMGK